MYNHSKDAMQRTTLPSEDLIARTTKKMERKQGEEDVNNAPSDDKYSPEVVDEDVRGHL